MSAFQRINCGVEGLDDIVDNVRLGDNVVVQVSNLNDFKKLAEPYVKQAIKDKRDVYYIRFSHHPAFFEEQEGLNIVYLKASEGFEKFSINVHNIIEEAGFDAFYVFDCLSDLQAAWFTDLMMGNFFRVTCPYLFELDTVAYFPVLRGHHDFSTIAKIQETTQIFINVYSDDENTFIHPLKVWNRYLPDMFLPHRLNEDLRSEVLSSSVDMSEYYRLLSDEQKEHAEQNVDSYERFFSAAKDDYYDGKITQRTLNKISRSLMTHDKKMAGMINEEFSPEDYFFIKDRVIGTGTIGGKACGMLLARKMIDNHLPQYASYIELQDSFYIATDVFYSYIVENNLWRIRTQQQDEESRAEQAKGIIDGHFSENIRAQFRRMLDYFGQTPIIVRSSSFLEDGFGNAFAGKYESIFCVNACDPEERLLNFETAIKRVYASTLDKSALEYRARRGLARMDEQMAILVQRVSGMKFDDYYMPCVAGVGFSQSIYRWSDDLSADAGLLRLVAGLGTKAVDRTGVDYPRLVNLDRPEITVLTTSEEKHRFSQRKMDVIEYSKNAVSDVLVTAILGKLPDWYVDLIAEHDYDIELEFRERGQQREVLFVSCQQVTKNEKLMRMMRDILKMLQEHYGTPVDIEYTINFREDGAFVINMLQCRPMSVWQAAAIRKIPEIPREDTLFKIKRAFMGNNALLPIDVVVYISASAYHNYPYKEKASVANIVSAINKYYKDSGKNMLLLSPGRIGTSSPELGVPVAFADISNFKIICEYANPEIGFVPELSYGSHMFQDIVESEMFYIAIMGTKAAGTVIFNSDFFEGQESILPKIHDDAQNYDPIVKVYELQENEKITLYADFKERQAICGKSSTTAENQQG